MPLSSVQSRIIVFMKLTSQQKKQLRGAAHGLKPLITVGDKGITPNLLNELKSALEHHELIKIKVRGSDREQRDVVISKLTTTAGAELVGRIGNVASIYKASKDNPKIRLA